MFLHRLSLENIRSLSSATLDFSAPEGGVRRWTCLLGENGTGKSTVLRAAALVLAGSEGLPALLGDPARWVRLGRKSGRITAVLANQEGQQREVSLELHRSDSLTGALKRNEAGLKLLDDALRHTLRNYFTAGFGVSRRMAGPESEKFRPGQMHPRAASVATLFQGDAPLRSVESWAMDLHYRRGQHGLQMVRQAMNEVLPGIRFAGIDKEARQLMFQTPDGKVPLAQLSDGFQNVISWFGDLLFRITEVFTDYRKPLTARGLLLLDEADLHLHPVWQRRVADYLLRMLPNFQFLVTTHSALAAQQCGPQELYVLKRKAKDVEILHYDGAPHLLRVDQLLVSPVFGIESGMSLRVSEARNRKQRTKADIELLQDVPRPRADAEAENEKVALLRDIKAALGRKGSAAVAGKAMSMGAARTASRPSRPAAFLRPSAAEVIGTALKKK